MEIHRSTDSSPYPLTYFQLQKPLPNEKRDLSHSIQKGERQAWQLLLDSSNVRETSLLTVDINDCEGPKGESSPTAQFSSHQLDNLCNLIDQSDCERRGGLQFE